MCNQIVEKNKTLEEENALLSNQLKELQELDAKKNSEITALKDDMSGMQSLIDQKTAEVLISLTYISLIKIRKTLFFYFCFNNYNNIT